MASNEQAPSYRVSTEQAEKSFRNLQHPLNPEAKRQTYSLGDHCGLSKLGVHLCHAAPRTASTTIHWHHHEEEFFYIIDAGEAGATLLTYRAGDKEPQEEPIKTGDFLGFPAGKGIGYALRAGDKELVYLCAGTRQALDICRYPTLDKTLVVDQTGGGSSFFLDNKNMEKWKR